MCCRLPESHVMTKRYFYLKNQIKSDINMFIMMFAPSLLYKEESSVHKFIHPLSHSKNIFWAFPEATVLS